MGIWKKEDEKLVGIKVVGLEQPFKTGDESITFICENNKSFRIWCDGDCCSHSWFEHMEMPEFPFTIKKVEEVAGKDLSGMPEFKNEYENGELDTYGLKMETDKGHLDIDMRNSSNGYYSGSFNYDLEGLK